ncbi:hypothetical protein SAY87_020949 [Trapa incisa]|uniref:Uncharacterized protein n=1 Tax=Trapa incisa TaxID=236973 RepID=A0AAN7JR45_9MYRT|nr:hypothetical protein SAY87_020949 [Trapa incisa]
MSAEEESAPLALEGKVTDACIIVSQTATSSIKAHEKSFRECHPPQNKLTYSIRRRANTSISMAARILLLSLLIFALSAVEAHEVRYTVRNTAPNSPGGKRFNRDLGASYTRHIMASSTEFIWEIFNQDSHPAQKKNVHLAACSHIS